MCIRDRYKLYILIIRYEYKFPCIYRIIFLLLYLMVTMKDKALLNLLLKNGWELTNF